MNTITKAHGIYAGGVCGPNSKVVIMLQSGIVSRQKTGGTGGCSDRFQPMASLNPLFYPITFTPSAAWTDAGFKRTSLHKKTSKHPF